jgi:hypothetical protein
MIEGVETIGEVVTGGMIAQALLLTLGVLG